MIDASIFSVVRHDSVSNISAVEYGSAAAHRLSDGPINFWMP